MKKNQKKSKKILWLCHWESPYKEEWKGGMGKYMNQLTSKMNHDFGYRFDIVTPNFSQMPSKQYLSPGVNLIRLEDVPGEDNIRNQEDMQRYADGVSKFIEGKEDDYALVHAHYWSSRIAGELLAKKGLPYVLQLHQLEKPMHIAYEGQGIEHELNNWRVEQERSAVENSDKTIFVSHIQAEEFKKFYYDKSTPKKLNGKINVVLNGADLNFFKPVGKRKLDSLLKSHGIPQDSFVIGYCGRLDPDKAVDRILYSVPPLLEKLSPEDADRVRIMITGKGKDVKYLESVAKKLKLNSRTHFYGYQTGKSLLEKFQVSDVGIIPSIHETFGLSVVEFMAAGKPVVVWKDSGGPEEIVNGTAGKVASSYEEISNYLYHLITNPEEKKNIGERARIRCGEMFNWNRVAKEVNDLYLSILSKHK